MFIPLMSSLLDDTGVEGLNRAECTRHVLRVLLKLASYSEVKSDLRNTVGKDIERALSQRIVCLAWNDALQLRMWRAFYAYVQTQNEDEAHELGMTMADLYYIKDNLKRADVAAVKFSELDWRKPPITQDDVNRILSCRSVRNTIQHYAYKLRFVSEIEPSLDVSDFRNDLRLHAIMTIYRYEASRSIEHIINSVNRAVANCWRDICDVWNAQKRTGDGRTKVDTGRKRNGKTIYEFDNHSIRTPMTISDENGNETEHPEIYQRATTIENEIEVRNFVERVSEVAPRYGRFLKITVLDEEDRKCDRWLARNLRLSKRETREGVDDEHYRQAVLDACRVTSRDEKRALKLYRK